MSTAVTKSLPKKLVLFPDTNIFIEAKDLRQVPWDELATNEITLLVCAAVRQEVDGHKTSDKNRVRKRALEWNSEFRKLLRPGAPPIVLREKSPGVTLAMAPSSLGGPAYSGLDLQKPDDQLVDATIKYRDSHKSEDVRLFTEDTGPLGKAYEIGLNCIELSTHWRRDLGPSEHEKEIGALNQKLKLYQNNCPKPVVRILDGQRKELTGIKLKVRPYRNLRSDEVEALIDELKQSDPPLTPDQLKSPDRIHPRFSESWIREPPTNERISKYLDEEYPAWIAETTRVLSELGTNLSIGSLIAELTIALINEGARPAESVKLTVTASGHIALLKNGVQPASLFTPPVIPNSPMPPLGKFLDPAMESLSWASRAYDAALFRNLNNLGSPYIESPALLPFYGGPQWDKHAWYLDEKGGHSTYTTQKIFTCDEWRHHEEPFEKTIWFRFKDNLTSGPAGAITLILHANNLPEPVQNKLPVEIEVEHLDVLQKARELLRLER